MNENPSARTEILNRLRRVEGQVRGLQRMIEDGRECADVVTQVAAARAALDRLGHRIVALNLRSCLDLEALPAHAEEELERSLAALARLHA
jgi:CsoR family transcriptional regulator, copper-sensing transcriptional repressor